MKIGKPLVIGIALAACATFVPMLRRSTSRSVRPVSELEAAAPDFDHEHSAALFVGVRTFRNDDLPEVPFAVDDAIDLAHLFALDDRVHLVDPRRVVIALSGEAVKPESQHRLRELKAAGARVTNAEHIFELLEQQAAIADRNGLLIVSFATHGVVRDGIPFILGASSEISTARMLDVIAQHEVPRSLILIDACRTRISGRGRGVNGSPAMIVDRRMPRIRGQVMLATVGEAYDDPFRRNGVFTAAVIDGLNCHAVAPRCCVTAETLGPYVEHVVHDWIVKHRNHAVGSATQISIDGAAKNMPLSHCCADKLDLRLSVASSIVTAFKGARQVWTHDLGSPIVSSGIADTSAVVGTPSELMAFNKTGSRLWQTTEHTRLRAFTIGDLFRKHTSQIIALWGSRVSIYSADGRVISTYDHPDPLEHLAICRPTSRHAPRIVVTSANSVFLLDPKKVATGKPIWCGHLVPRSETIAKVNIADYDHDTKSDIEIATVSGRRLVLDFRGKVIRRGDGLAFELDRRRRKRN